MSQSSRHGLNPVIRAMRAGLHVLVTGLLAFVVVVAIVDRATMAGAIVAIAVVMFVTWCAGSLPGPRRRLAPSRRWRMLWIAALLLEWAALLWMTPHAAYLVFPLCFAMLVALPGLVGMLAVTAATIAVVVALGIHNGWSVGGIVGPIVGAIVAIIITWGSRALDEDAREHERLFRELELAQHRLAETERAAGAIAERARLAREIHDTVAQNLSSITLLLHAAERADPDGDGVEHLQAAQRSAGEALADARRLVRDLAPEPLADGGLASALRDLAVSTAAAGGIEVAVIATEPIEIPMTHQVALLRIAQGTLGNVIRHADARSASVEIVADRSNIRMTVTDDGRGFDPAVVDAHSTHGSFGLRSVQERVGQLDGVATVISAPGEGTRVIVELPLEPEVPS